MKRLSAHTMDHQEVLQLKEVEKPAPKYMKSWSKFMRPRTAGDTRCVVSTFRARSGSPVAWHLG